MKKQRTKWNKINLASLQSAVKDHKVIPVSNDNTVTASNINVVKRDGTFEPFNTEKLRKVVKWACDNEFMEEELLRDTEIKLHNEIKITDMYKQLIYTAVGKISLLNTSWENVAAKLQLLEYYKETYNISHHKDYPHIKDVLNKGTETKIYDKNTLSKYSESDIEEINSFINPERDNLFNYKALVTFFDKYCLNYAKTKKLELPQHAYMRVAIALMVNENDRLTKIKELYDSLSTHLYTVATPIMLNALTPKQQLSSCVLNTVGDDSHSILDTGKNLGIYSKFKGGTALDVTALRAKGSYIEGNQGYSSGPVPFIQNYERIMKAFNQGSKRPGALAVYFSWWHLDVWDLLSLKSNGGTDENRARGLQYACKLNQIFIDAVLNDEDIYLFDPKDVPKLLKSYGEKFNQYYKIYSSKTSIRKKKIKARELAFKIFKERTETGNIYLFHEENVNQTTMLNRYIGSSNLCTEILEPSRPSITVSEELITTEDNEKRILKQYRAGEIALCNLSSINCERWFYLTEEEKTSLCNIIVRALDNTIDLSFYPVKEGKHSNLMYRYIGVGTMNVTNYLALKKIVIDTQESLEETDKLFDDISYKLISASMNLSKEKGRFEKFYETEWAKGKVPYDKRIKTVDSLTNYRPNKERWNDLRQNIIKYGLRNAQIMAIAPTATSGKSINALESIEPIQNFFYKEEGTITVPTIVSNFRKNNQYYKLAFECDQEMLLKLAAVRQKWIDQAQSINVYIKKPDSLMDLIQLHFLGFYYGIKTYYYLKQQKETDSYVCESCS